MASFTLPAATYETSSRQVQLKLNTIIEDECPLEEGEADQERGRSRSPSSRFPNLPSPIPSSASTISSYYRRSRLSREFDDLYDVSESESDQDSIEVPDVNIQRASGDSQCSLKRSSWSGQRRNRYPSLVIPSPRHWPTIEKLKRDSAMPPTPPAKIPLSPEVLSKLNARAPTSSNPPSLDGSLMSDQIAASSAPSTPSEFFHPESVKNWSHLHFAGSDSELSDDGGDIAIEIPDFRGSGVRLPQDALDILQHLSLEIGVDDMPAVNHGDEEMQEIQGTLTCDHNIELEAMSATSEYSIAQLSIPSPGGFFSGLDEDSKQAWFSIKNTLTDKDAPPSSTTAEHFYNAPWNDCQNHIVEQVVSTIEVETEGPTTAVYLPNSPNTMGKTNSKNEHQDDEVDSEPVLEILNRLSDPKTESAHERTAKWATNQDDFLAFLRESIEIDSKAPSTPTTGAEIKSPETPESAIKRAVRFLDTEVAKEAARVASSPTAQSDSIFYYAFQHLSNTSSPTDSFIHRQTRFDALQAQRTSLQLNHVNSLLGNYQIAAAKRPSPQRPISMMPGKEDTDEKTAEQSRIDDLELGRQAIEQVEPANWVVEALRYLSGGHLFNSPVASVLGKARPLETTTLPEHVRVLDLGGQPQCDWAWHCARDFSNIKTYTATCDPHVINEQIRGPSSHRLVKVDNLWSLPFPANHFDAVSARSLPTFLRTMKPLGNEQDEYDLCLKECLRVLKPGGYLEFFVLDAELVDGGHPAPLGDKLSVEFGFALRRLGYDPNPSKSFLGRIRRAGFTEIKRAWMFLPMGAPNIALPPLPETPPPHASMYEDQIMQNQVEAVQGPVGNTADVAYISGLLGSWLWEQWLLKLQLEAGKKKGADLIKDVSSVIEEGKASGGGWRVLRGWARKSL